MNKLNFFLGLFLGRVCADTKYTFVISFILKIKTEVLYIKLLIMYLTIIAFFKFQLDTYWIKLQWCLDVIWLKIQWFVSDYTQMGAIKMEYEVKNFLVYCQGFQDGIIFSFLVILVAYFCYKSKKTT